MAESCMPSEYAPVYCTERPWYQIGDILYTHSRSNTQHNKMVQKITKMVQKIKNVYNSKLTNIVLEIIYVFRHEINFIILFLL